MENSAAIPSPATSLFRGRELLIATKHQKEKVLAPLLQETLGIIPRTAEDYDTDAFGTFSGEVERPAVPLETLRLKCLKAMDLFHADLAIASEGSFGPHPAFPFLAAGEEWLILIDQKNQLEIIVREISTETNFSSRLLNDENSLQAFAENAGFPSHALILRNKQQIRKGIQIQDDLFRIFNELQAGGLPVTAETDMRAHLNPTRMKQIEALGRKLADKILSTCPHCQWPGFEAVQADQGLPCADCGAPTALIRQLHFRCKKCDFSQIRSNPDGHSAADPGNCLFCNP